MPPSHTRLPPLPAPIVSDPRPHGTASGLLPDVARLLDQLDAELAALRRGLRLGTAGDVDGRLLWCQTIGEIVRLRLEAEAALGGPGAAPGAGPHPGGSRFPGSPA